ncbi:hypothetical protein J3F83DRAFT_746975 [Trichoderma novae-zelandiae]
MSCSCRLITWRTFARGLTQIHRSDHSSMQLRWPTRQLVILGQSRGLHGSGYRRQDGAATAVKDANGHDEGASRSTSAEDAQTSASTAKVLDEVVAEPNEQPAERIRAKRDGKKRFAAASDPSNDTGDSRNTTPNTKWERKPRPSSAESNWTDSSEQPSQPGPRTQEPWKLHKAALKEKFPQGWQPRKRLSPDALAGIRALNAQFPDVYTTAALADKFQVSGEAIRRILKSNWRPSTDEEEERQQRWFRRGKQVWEQKAALGIKPPQRWRMEGIARDPGYHEWSKRASQREREWEEEEVSKYRAYREKMKKKAEGKEKGRW